MLVFAIHHAIADGWSLGVLVQDLFAAYIEVVMGSTGALLPVPQTYTAWGATERAFWQPAVVEQRVEFWRTKLAGSPRMWSLPITSGPPKRWLSAIPANLTNETRELARQTTITFFSALFGAFQLAFSEWSGFDDLVVGTPVANRTRQTARETMGYYYERDINKRLTRLPTPSLSSSWCTRSVSSRRSDTIHFSRFALLCRTIPCRRFRCRIFRRV